MIKRNSRNIGKIVQVMQYSDFNGRLGKVSGFRADFGYRDPWVTVFIFPSGGVFSFPGSQLAVVDLTRDEALAVSRRELKEGKYAHKGKSIPGGTLPLQ